MRSTVIAIATAFFCQSIAVRAEAPPANIGQRIEQIPITASERSGKIAVVAFLSFECPVSNEVVRTLVDLAEKYRPRGVAFAGVAVNDDMTDANLARHVKEFAVPFRVVADREHKYREAFQATATPEVFVLNAESQLRYRGRIDDTWSARLKKNSRPGRQDLKEALDELLADKPVSVAVTTPVGCLLPGTATPSKPSTTVTYYRDVLPILQQHCQGCHRPGEVGPFALMNYRQAVNWASDIKEYTQNHKMPPWKPVAGPSFHNERRLTNRELATLATWVDGGTPEGDAKDAPPPRSFVRGWQLGEPDLVLTVEGDFQLGPSGDDLFRCFVLPTRLAEDRYVTAIEVRPGNPRIVHHTLQFVDTSGQARKLQAEQKPSGDDVGPGYTVGMGIGFPPRDGGLGGWAPGQVPRYLPDGTGYFLPKGADVVLQVHYHRDGRAEKDRTSVGLYLNRTPIAKRFQGMVVPGRFLMIPAGAEQHRVSGSMEVKQDCQLYTVMPHMHKLGKEIQVTMTPPDGDRVTLIGIRDWDYNWQETYFLKQPLSVKAGTRFDIEAIYNNTDKNPNNPFNPPRPVMFGQRTTNEMCLGFLGATSDTPGRIKFEVKR
jgi:hypothetical protein